MPSDECCRDWGTELEKVNAPIMLNFVRTGTQYTGKPFVFCPWCGAQRKDVNLETPCITSS